MPKESALYLPLEGYEVSVLFLIFVGISLTWEVLLGVLTFCNNLLRGKRASWLDRVKEELLALGVVSLVLLFVQPVLERVCKPSDLTVDFSEVDVTDVAGAYYVCPPGTRNVFPATVIHAAHYLLFYLAVVHIVFNMATNSITSRKFAKLVELERVARNKDMQHEQQLLQARLEGNEEDITRIDPLLKHCDEDDEDLPVPSGSNDGSDHTSASQRSRRSLFARLGRWFKKFWNVMTNNVDQQSFSLLRKICMQRFEAHAMDSNVRSFSYINIASQVLEADLDQVYAHAWLMILFMTILLIYPKLIYQVVWANGLCFVVLIILSVKFNKIMTNSVVICRQVLMKGVEKQKHLRKEEALLKLAGSHGESSEDGSSDLGDGQKLGTASLRAPSFSPFKRGKSMMRSDSQVSLSPSVDADNASAAGDNDRDRGVSPQSPRRMSRFGMIATSEAVDRLNQASATRDGSGAPLSHDVIRAVNTDRWVITTTRDADGPQAASNVTFRPAQAATQSGGGMGGFQAMALPVPPFGVPRPPQPSPYPMDTTMNGQSASVKVAGNVRMSKDRRASTHVTRGNTQNIVHEVRRMAGTRQTATLSDVCSRISQHTASTSTCKKRRVWHKDVVQHRSPVSTAPHVCLAVPEPPLHAPLPPPSMTPHFDNSSMYDFRAQAAWQGLPTLDACHENFGHSQWRGLPHISPQMQTHTWPALQSTGNNAQFAAHGMCAQGIDHSNINATLGGVCTATMPTGPGMQSVGWVTNQLNGLTQSEYGALHSPRNNSDSTWQQLQCILDTHQQQLQQGTVNALVPASQQQHHHLQAGAAVPASKQQAQHQHATGQHQHKTGQSHNLPDRESSPPARTNNDVFSHTYGRRVNMQQAATSNGKAWRKGASSGSSSHHNSNPVNSGGIEEPTIIPLTRGKPDCDKVLNAKHARERAKGDKSARRQAKFALEQPHLAYKTLADLAEEVEEKIKHQFWLSHPSYMLWIINTIFLITSLSITTAVALVIPYNKFQKLASLQQATHIWLPVVIIDFLIAIYLSWYILPLHALITTAGTSFPPRVIEEVRAAKTLSHEEHHGISGMVLGFLNHVFVGVHHERREALDLATYFVASLADHAGIVLSPHLRSMCQKGSTGIMCRAEVREVLREFAQFWHDMAWYGPPDDDYVIRADLTFMRSAFGELDADGSGALSFGELAQMVRSLGALATAGDIETMLWEVDLDGSRSVGFDEFVKFLAYAFFDMDANGYVGIDEIEDGMKKLGFKRAGPDACTLLMNAADHNSDHRIGMREFFMLFEKLQVEEGDDDDAGSGDGDSKQQDKARCNSK